MFFSKSFFIHIVRKHFYMRVLEKSGDILRKKEIWHNTADKEIKSMKQIWLIGC